MNAEVREEAASAADIPLLPTVGNQLALARESKGLSVGDVAQALKLGVRQVEGLESGEWGALPGATFIRGFVRNYARLVELDPSPLMAQLDGVVDPGTPRLDRPKGPQTPMPLPGAGRRRDFAVVGFGLGLVALALLLYFVLPSDLSGVGDGLRSLVSLVKSEEPPQAPSASLPPAEPVLPPGATPQQVLTPQAAAEPSPPAGTPVPSAASEMAVVATAAPPGADAQAPPIQPPAEAGSGAALLHFRVERESWVEVKDRDGNLLLSRRLAAGSEHSIEARGQLSLIIGNAGGVRLSHRGQAVDLVPHTRGDVARLTLD